MEYDLCKIPPGLIAVLPFTDIGTSHLLQVLPSRPGPEWPLGTRLPASPAYTNWSCAGRASDRVPPPAFTPAEVGEIKDAPGTWVSSSCPPPLRPVRPPPALPPAEVGKAKDAPDQQCVDDGPRDQHLEYHDHIGERENLRKVVQVAGE